MANDEKFSKTIDDEQLDEVAGGTKKENAKDIAFLNAVGKDDYINLSADATPEEVQEAWSSLGIDFKYRPKKSNYYETDDDVFQITRQDAMILAMRRTKTVVDLDDYR